MGNLTEGKERQNIDKRLKEKKPKTRGFTKTKKWRIPKKKRRSERRKSKRREEIEGGDCEIQERRRFQKKEKRSVFPILLSLCPLLTPLCTSQSPRKSNDNFSAHLKIEINYF